MSDILSVGGTVTDLHIEVGLGDGSVIATIDTGPIFNALDLSGLGAVGDLVDSLGLSFTGDDSLTADAGTSINLDPNTIITLPDL